MEQSNFKFSDERIQLQQKYEIVVNQEQEPLQLARGKMCKVYEFIFRENYHPVAIKKSIVNDEETYQFRMQFYDRIIKNSLRFPDHIVQILDPRIYKLIEDYGVPSQYVRHKLILLVMEKGQSLDTWLQQNQEQLINFHIIEDIIYQILDIYYNLYEKQNYVHFGLKLQKFIISSSKTDKIKHKVKIQNIGHFNTFEYEKLQELIQIKQKQTLNQENDKYLSPELREIFEKDGYICVIFIVYNINFYYDQYHIWKVKKGDQNILCQNQDKYCIGLILLKIIANDKIPSLVYYQEAERTNFIGNLRKNNKQRRISQFIDVIQQLLDKDPNERWTIDKCRSYLQFNEKKELYQTLEKEEIPLNTVEINYNQYGIYRGQVNEDGREHGIGLMKYPDGTIYKGEWSNGKRDGYGVCYYEDKDRYEGQFSNNKKHGRGIYYFSDGARYEGLYLQGQKNGQGVYFYFDGDIYEGSFCNDQFAGEGTYYFQDGKIYKGQWMNGMKHGIGYYINKQGDHIQTEYNMDQQILKNSKKNKNK